MPYTQQKRLLSLDTPLGPDALLVRGFSGWEAISTPFELEIDLASENDAIDLRGLLAASVTLHITLSDETLRHWNGRLNKIVQGPREPIFTSYHVTVVPWFSFLRLRQDCRMFQDKTVQEIVTEVFTKLGFHDFEFRLHGSLQKREYCVQYRETDFHFVSRLLEEEGIFYFFVHESGRHTMVMANTSEAHLPCPGNDTARCLQASGGSSEEDVVTDWDRNEEFLTSSLSLADYNFKTPATRLMASLDGNTPFEMYDYPGLFKEKQAGESLARIQLEEISAPASVIQGESTCRAFTSGYRFRLRDHYRQEWNSEYVLTEVHHTAVQGSDYHAGSIEQSGGVSSYRNRFLCIPRSVPFRPIRKTARPIIMGCQTAVVVGPAGEEIHTDEIGRIKVQFHWDRQGQKDEKSSCWIRVSQTWAGKNYGAIAIPRIGQEVIIEFLEGNPDRPIITGCVYNGQMTPPYALPANKDMTGLKSYSTKGGNGYNEIVFIDRTGNELIRIHGQKDVETTVLHDKKEIVNNNRNVHVLKELRTQVDEKVSHTINGDLAEYFSRNHAEVVGAERYLSASRVIIEADDEICIKVGGNHVSLSRSGVYVQGAMVEINCGHPPQQSTLRGLTPSLPDDPIAVEAAAQTTAISPLGGSAGGASGVSVPRTGFLAPAAAGGAPSDFGSAAAPKSTGKGLSTGLGHDVDQLAENSPTLKRNLADLQEHGWRIKYGPSGKGSYTWRSRKEIVIDKDCQGNASLTVQTLAHESGHAKYTRDSYVAADGKTRKDYVDANAQVDLKDEGEATITNIEVRNEIKENGGPDIGIAGAQSAKYDDAYQNAAAATQPAQRDKLRKEIGDIYKDGEHPSTDPTKTYGDYYGEIYGKWYDEHEGKKKP